MVDINIQSDDMNFVIFPQGGNFYPGDKRERQFSPRLGLVYEAVVSHREEDNQRRVDVKMTLTAPGCGMGEILVDDVRSKVEMIPTIAEADVELVFDPPWGRHMMSEAARLETGML